MTPDQLLLAFHATHPGITARALGRGRIEDGRSSYQLLADAPDAGDRVLDLGCGDGLLLELLVARGFASSALVGVDMSPEELAAARRRPALRDVRLDCERAQRLSLADASVDCCLSHLAFMLMSDIEAVVAGLARVLRPGGRFVTVVGGGPGSGDAFELFLDLFRPVHDRLEVRAPRISDRRARDREGMAQLFHAGTGFGPVDETCHALQLDGDAETVWQSLAPIYEMFVMPPEVVDDLHAKFLSAAARLAGPGGAIPCTMRIRCLTARRTDSGG